MGKYDPLGGHLLRRTDEVWLATFGEIDEILGFPLPPSARRHRSWWANDHSNSHAKAWLEAGWRAVGVDVDAETVSFVREGNPRSRRTW